MYRPSRGPRPSDAIRKLCWNQKYGLLADTPAQTHFSQHANILGIWLDVIPQAQQKTVLAKLLSGSITRFQARFSPAADVAGHLLFSLLSFASVAACRYGPGISFAVAAWRDMLALGLTTWAEQPEPTRSDSHAWSAHPNYDLLTIVAGIRPAGPGFRPVTIAPNLGTLQHVSATMAHPDGEIKVEYTAKSGNLEARVNLPAGISGTLLWQGKAYEIHEGTQNIELQIHQSGQ